MYPRRYLCPVVIPGPAQFTYPSLTEALPRLDPLGLARAAYNSTKPSFFAMVQTPAKPLTLDAFLQLPETKPASEYIDGQIIQKPMPQGQHSRLQQKLLTAINAVTEDNATALALPELRCTFGGRSLLPDVAVFRWSRLPTNDDGTIANTFNAHPDWAIEILSPEQSSTRVTSNLLHCLRHGAQLGWLIDPNEQLVQVYHPAQALVSLEEPGDQLPVPEFAQGVSLTVGQVFGWLRVGR